jgi:hypothetical protein
MLARRARRAATASARAAGASARRRARRAVLVPLPAAALNPTYTYGKRATPDPSCESGGARPTPPRDSAASGKGATPPAAHATPPPAPKPVYIHHGHKASLLISRLPPAEGEAGA